MLLRPEHSCHDAYCHAFHEGPAPLGRRGFVKLAALTAGAGLAASWIPNWAFASGTAEAIMLSCMDYRMVDPQAKFMSGKGLDGEYDHVVLAGASLGVVSKKFGKWHDVFWEHLDVAIKLHKVHQVIVIDHQDCGAYKLALGDDAVDTPEKELAAHTATIQTFAKLVEKHHPNLPVEGYFMALDGTAEPIEL